MYIEQRKEFLAKFSTIKNFEYITPFIDSFGFSVQKRLNEMDVHNISLLSFNISKLELNNSTSRKRLQIRSTYGRKEEGSVSMRESSKIKFSDPVDMESRDDYFYNIKSGDFYRGKKYITPQELLNMVYSDHIKTTKKVKGLWLRTKLFFWKILIKNIAYLISQIFYSILFVISGDKYSFEPLSKREKLNGVEINEYEPLIDEYKPLKNISKEREKINFFGISGNYWPIVFYSWLHLVAYSIHQFHKLDLLFLTNIFKNNFLTLIYVISSFSIVDILLPMLLKKGIKLFSELSSKSLYRKIKI